MDDTCEIRTHAPEGTGLAGQRVNHSAKVPELLIRATNLAYVSLRIPTTPTSSPHCPRQQRLSQVQLILASVVRPLWLLANESLLGLFIVRSSSTHKTLCKRLSVITKVRTVITYLVQDRALPQLRRRCESKVTSSNSSIVFHRIHTYTRGCTCC